MLGDRYISCQTYSLFHGFLFNTDEQFFGNTDYLNQWRKAGKKKKSSLPGHTYFQQIESYQDSHCVVGELYFQFSLSINCDHVGCDLCARLDEIKFPVIDPVPQPVPCPESGHYKTYGETLTSVNGHLRPVDDYQPRKQCSVLFDNGQLDPNMIEEVAAFAKNFLVKKELVLDHLHHKQELKMKKDMRMKKNTRGKEVTDEEPVTSDIDSERETDSEAEESDVVMNMIGGSDEDNVTVVPHLHTVTRHGRIAGTWMKALQCDTIDSKSDDTGSDDTENDSSEYDSDTEVVKSDDDMDVTNSEISTRNKCVHVTRSGRRAGIWRSYQNH
jgi:hypothetical protein